MAKDLKPWTKVGGRNVLYSLFGKFLATQDYVNRNNGKIETYALFGQKSWFTTLVVTDDRQVVTVSEFKQGRDSWGLELPAGTFSGDDQPAREIVAENVQRETGYSGTVIYLGYTWLATRGSPTRVWHYCMLHAQKSGDAKLDTSEDIICETMPLGEWIDAVQNGEITEHSAVVATMRALPLLNVQLVHGELIDRINEDLS